MTITAEDREKLGEELEAIEKVLAGLFEARKPFQQAIALMEGQREVILERYGISDDFQNCEGCNTIVLGIDECHRCDDGPILCVECAPTWSDMETQMKEWVEDCKKDPDRVDEISSAERGLANVQAQIAAGNGDKKHVW